MTDPLVNHTIHEAARVLRCSAVNVYQLVKRGELVAVRFGRRVVVTDEDLRAFIQRHRTERAAG
jgi:excisionase family DNA binding protein